ncbi:MAG: NAD(P)/FAD-dependent oxidoreductase [Flavobacteriales bacterium]
MQLLSFWEKEIWFTDIDLLVIGSGISGLNAAIHFKKLNPKAKVLVLERGMLPYGASSRNAGFACFGSLSELLEDLSHMSESDVLHLLQERFEGLRLLREMHGDEILRYETCGGSEIFTSAQEKLFADCMQLLPEINEKVKEITCVDNTYLLNDKEISRLGFKDVEHLIYNQCEGAIDTGRMMHNLLKLAIAADVRILNHSEVTSWHEDQSGVKVLINGQLEVNAARMLVATNGFAAQLLQLDDLQPGRTQVLITEPIDDLKVKGCFHFEAGYVYFRNVGNRILLGGGRHLDKVGETTVSMETTASIQDYLEELLQSTIIPNQAYRVAQRWSGILGLGKYKKPIIKPYSSKVFCAVRLGGMGVAIGTKTGRDAAEMITSS